MKRHARLQLNIGISSLILILIVLALVSLGVLSISSADNDMKLAEKNAAAVKEYYRASSEGQKFLSEVDGIILNALKENPDGGEACSDEIKTKLGDYYDAENGCASSDIAMDAGLALRVTAAIQCDPAMRYIIDEYKVYIKDDYEIDQTRPVWTGLN